MTAIGLLHYGGTLGLYNQPPEEWARALAYYEHADEMRAEDRLSRKRARDHKARLRGAG